MYKSKCIVLKLLNTPPLVKVRIVGMRCEDVATYCVVRRSDNVLGWEMVGMYADREKAVERVSRFFDKLILYK
jgi:hypothetical protein